MEAHPTDEQSMRALMLTGDQQSVVRQVPRPVPAHDEVLVRVTVSAVCGSDLPHYRKSAQELGHRLHTVPGHEAVGVIAQAAASGDGPAEGTRVIVYQHSGCGDCTFCLSGEPMFCADRRTLGNHRSGADAEYLTAPATGVLPVPDDLSDAMAALIACNFGTAYSAFRKSGVAVGDRVAVFGLGPVGCCVVALAAAAGAEVFAVDPIEGRRDLAKTLGAGTAIDPIAQDPVAAVAAVTEGRGPEVIFECSANPTAQTQVMKLARPHGTVVLLGANNSMEIDPGVDVIRKELRVIGSWVFTQPEFPAVLRAARSLPALQHLITDPFPAQRAPDALAAADAGHIGKVLIDWS
ncbi:zinc-binding dehydrogenase [Micromonospora sp. NPDC051196]|uniref:zinc-dependent alcohol dehydrogenase n=1 Tax=Micromonospora sp. NPDC051196 TaxID=3155281 RepID=UPI003423098D